MLFPAKRGCHSGSLRETRGVQVCVLISCPEVYSPITNCPITGMNCVSSVSCKAIIDLWRDLRAVTSEIRPDWDLSNPELRAAWKAGDQSRFHGWNKKASAETNSITRRK